MLSIGEWKQRMPRAEDALPGREHASTPAFTHHVHGRPLQQEAFPGSESVLFGMGCFWGAERKFWSLPGVLTTAVGYAGGYTPNPTYHEVCSGMTGHAEVVKVVYDSSKISFESLLKVFWESHDPTQGMRQGNDVGTQYRSAIYTSNDAQFDAAQAAEKRFQEELARAGYGSVTTEIAMSKPFYFAEEEHQQYLSKNPDGYCGLGGTGVACPIGIAAPAS